MDKLAIAIQAGRRMVARGERPAYHALCRWDGTAMDVEIPELAGVHLFVPSRPDVVRGARTLIARHLDVPESAFDVEVVDRS